MGLKVPNNLQSPFLFKRNKESPAEGDDGISNKYTENPFADTFLDHYDPLCKLNLEKTSDVMKSFPVSTAATEIKVIVDSPNHTRKGAVPLVCQRRLSEAPPTPLGRNPLPFNTIGSPISTLSRKPFPSKWDDAEKWLVSSSANGSPAHIIKPETQRVNKPQNHVFQHKSKPLGEKIKVSKGKTPFLLPSIKDKFTDSVNPVKSNSRSCESMPESSLFSSSIRNALKDAGNVVVEPANHRDVGTEMTPLGSTMNSRRPTPVKLPSPPRHNTPAACSGPLGSSVSPKDISEINAYHFCQFEPINQFDLYPLNWSSREDEEEKISRSLMHFEIGNGRKSIGDCKTSIWEDEDKRKHCIRYQREEAKIQAWMDLQNAKTEALSRKLEVKLQKMRSDLEEKLFKRMATVHRRAEEWRASARSQHAQDIRVKAAQQSSKMKTLNSLFQENPAPCNCFL